MARILLKPQIVSVENEMEISSIINCRKEKKMVSYTAITHCNNTAVPVPDTLHIDCERKQQEKIVSAEFTKRKL
jgi:hypothetical protein